MSTSPAPGSQSASQLATQSALADNTYFANEAIVNDYQPQADNGTHSNAQAYLNAVAAAKQAGTAPPTGYYKITVNTALVLALYTGTDTNEKDWDNIFVSTWYTPPGAAAPVVKPAGYPVGAYTGRQDSNGLKIYYDLSGGTYGANGATYSDSRGSFTYNLVVTPFGNEAWWTLAGS